MPSAAVKLLWGSWRSSSSLLREALNEALDGVLDNQVAVTDMDRLKFSFVDQPINLCSTDAELEARFRD